MTTGEIIGIFFPVSIVIVILLNPLYKDIYGDDVWHDFFGLLKWIFMAFTVISLLYWSFVIGKRRAVIATSIVLLIIGTWTVPYFVRYKVQRYLTTCKSNLKVIGTAMEMYSSGNQGRYPHTIGALTPDYLKTLPTGPASKRITYQYTRTEVPDCYTAWCQGTYHTAVCNANMPEYNAVLCWDNSHEKW